MLFSTYGHPLKWFFLAGCLCTPPVQAQDLSGIWTDDDTGNRAQVEQEGNRILVTVLGEEQFRNAQGFLSDDRVELQWTSKTGKRLKQLGSFKVSTVQWDNGTVWRRPPIQIVKNRAGVAQAVRITVRGQGYLLIPDTANPLVWYYVPDTVRLVERQIDGQTWPDLSVVYFQKLDPADGSLNEGATLYFSAPIRIDDLAILDVLADRLIDASPVLKALTTHMPWRNPDGSLMPDAQWSAKVQWQGPESNRYTREFPLFPRNVFETRQDGRFISDPVFEVIPAGTRSTLHRKYRFLGTNAFLSMQELKVLPQLQLRPLPVVSTTMRVSRPPSPDQHVREAEFSSTQDLHQPVAEIGDPERDPKYAKMPFLANLDRTGARLIDDILTNAVTGLKVSASLQYHLPETYRLAVAPADPGRILNDWLERLSQRTVRSKTEHEIVKILYAERMRAYSLGYRPDHLSERWAWAGLIKESDFQIVEDDANNPLWNDQMRLVRLAAFYLVDRYHAEFSRLRHSYLVDMDGNPHEIGNESYRAWIEQMFIVRRSEGPSFLNFMTHPSYRGRPAYDTRSREANSQWVLYPSREAHEIPLQDAVMLFEKQVFKTPVLTGINGGPLTKVWREIDVEYQIPWANRQMEKELRTVELDASYINLSKYSDAIVGKLMRFEDQMIRPGAIYLPDPWASRTLGYTEIVITPRIQFLAGADPLFTKQLTAALQSTDPQRAGREDIRVVDHQEFVSLVFPSAVWNEAEQWKDLPSPLLQFDFGGIDPDFAAALKVNHRFLNAQYVLQYQIKHPGGDVEFQETLPVFEGVQAAPYLHQRLETIGQGDSLRLQVIKP